MITLSNFISITLYSILDHPKSTESLKRKISFMKVPLWLETTDWFKIESTKGPALCNQTYSLKITVNLHGTK